jgi:hypothetical protein
MQKTGMVLGLILRGFVLVTVVSSEEAAQSSLSEPKGQIVVIEQSYEDYRVRITGPTDYRATLMESTLEIFKGDKQVFQKNEWRFYFGHRNEREYSNDIIRIGTDITGNGKPNLVVRSWSGGAHCCHFFLIFELGDTFRQIATIDVMDSGSAHFEDRDGDANLEFVFGDYTFAYWNECFADSPVPKVVLRFSGNGYHIAEDQMRGEPPSDAKIRQIAARIAETPSRSKDLPPTPLWGTMLEWIYKGNADAAWQLFDLAWQPEMPGKDEFLKSFKTQLETSPWWPDIKAMNAQPERTAP